MADPVPVAQTFFVDEKVRHRTKLDAIVTVADAKHLLREIDRAHEAQEQLAFADVRLTKRCSSSFMAGPVAGWTKDRKAGALELRWRGLSALVGIFFWVWPVL